MRKLRPLHDRIIVKRLEKEVKSAGGIIIPDSAKEKPIEGIIESVGNGRTDSNGKLVPMTVKKGDVILFAKYSGNEIKVDAEEYLIMREDDVLAIIEKK
jgi:chaperonin GroES